MLRKDTEYSKVARTGDEPVATEVFDTPAFEVIAPCDLNEGFEFAVKLGNSVYQVRTVRCKETAGLRIIQLSLPYSLIHA